MAEPTETPVDGTVSILTIVLLVFSLAGLALTFLAYQATALP
jgi:hypothetical protein